VTGKAETNDRIARVAFRNAECNLLQGTPRSLPRPLGTGLGAERRRSLGLAIVRRLIVSQMPTLSTTPVISLALARLPRRRAGRTNKRPGVELAEARVSRQGRIKAALLTG
jgi:hypothetical protein